MANRSQDLNALIGSRICHDLISPLGAIGNGLELLAMSGANGAEMALISESVTNANARIRFYRVAFGSASEGQSMGRNEIANILQDLTQGSRLNIIWMPVTDCPRPMVKLAFLLLQCFETAMPYGGETRVTLNDGQWRITGSANKLKIDPELWELLSRPETELDITPAQVQFALIPDLMAQLGRKLTLQISDTEISAVY
ncbi:MAG: histidine phosphotransferase family protein [Mangrovicoccus sp.]